MKLGERVKSARQARSRSQTQLGEALGISRQAVVRLEKGYYDMGVDTLQKIADILDMTPGQLVRGTFGAPSADRF